MDGDSAADELYSLDPADFIQRRTELVAQARSDGDRELARTLARLRRPPLAAWLINQLVRERPDVLDELSGFAARIRSAHRGLQGDQLRALTGERQHVLDDVLSAVARLAADRGASVTDPVRQQVRETAEAAIADEAAEAAVASGRLTDVLSYSGFGAVDVTDAVAVGLPRRVARPSPQRPRGPRAVPDRGTSRTPSSDASAGRAEKAGAAAARQDAEDLAQSSADAELASAERDAAEQALAEAADRLTELEEAVVVARATVRAATIARTNAVRKAERAELRRLALQRRIERRDR